MDTEDALLDVEDTPEGLEGLEDIPGTEGHALGAREQRGMKAVLVIPGILMRKEDSSVRMRLANMAQGAAHQPGIQAASTLQQFSGASVCSSPEQEPVFLNVYYGAQESIPRNEFRQPL
jgi:hypothetical protein